MTTSPGTIESGGRGSAGDEPVPHGEDVSGTDDTVPSGAGYEPMSIRGPAFIVLGLAVVILIGGVVASAISSGSDPTFVLRKVTLSDGTPVALAPATSKLHAIISNDEPPADIIGNLGILKASTVTGVLNSDQNASQFDRTVDLHSELAQGQVNEAYALMLKHVGWQVIYNGPAPQGVSGTTEVLAKRGSGDGFYWETGIVVSPTTPAGVTPYSVEVFETPDGN